MSEDQKLVLAAAAWMLQQLEQSGELSIDDVVADTQQANPEYDEELVERALWTLTSRGLADLTWDGKLRPGQDRLAAAI